MSQDQTVSQCKEVNTLPIEGQDVKVSDAEDAVEVMEDVAEDQKALGKKKVTRTTTRIDQRLRKNQEDHTDHVDEDEVVAVEDTVVVVVIADVREVKVPVMKIHHKMKDAKLIRVSILKEDPLAKTGAQEDTEDDLGDHRHKVPEMKEIATEENMRTRTIKMSVTAAEIEVAAEDEDAREGITVHVNQEMTLKHLREEMPRNKISPPMMLQQLLLRRKCSFFFVLFLLC